PPRVAAAFGPHNRPAHQKNGVTKSSVGTGASTASRSDASPTRANAPPAASADVDPRSASRSTGSVPTRDGVRGNIARAKTDLTTMPVTQAISARRRLRVPRVTSSPDGTVVVISPLSRPPAVARPLRGRHASHVAILEV